MIFKRRERAEDRLSQAFFGLVAFSLAGSLLARRTGLDPGPIAPIASLLTLGTGVAAVFAAYVRTVPYGAGRLVAGLIVGASSEIVGLKTGFPFGRYVYTDVWWPTVKIPGIGPFPLSLPFAWLLMAGAARLALGEKPDKARSLVFAVLGGLLAATVDLAMEPVMAGTLRYWRWLEHGSLPGGAPFANFLGWWAVATIAGLVLTVGAPEVPSRHPRGVLIGFVALILGLGLIG